MLSFETGNVDLSKTFADYLQLFKVASLHHLPLVVAFATRLQCTHTFSYQPFPAAA